MLRDSFRMIASLACCALMMPPASAEPPEQSVTVSNCRVVLSQRASLAGSRQGIIRDISVTEGDVVESGQVIATLRDDIARQQLAVTEKEMANTIDLRLYKKISELATLEYSKAIELNRTIPGAFSELDVKKLRLAAEKSVLQIEQADFHLQMAALRKKEAEVTLESYRIVTPCSGVVLQVHKQPGEASGVGEVIVEIANFDVMRVEGFIPVTSSGRIQRGAPVVVEVTGVDSAKTSRFEGRLKHIAPIVNEVSQEVRVWAEVENRNHLLKDGLPASMTIKTGKIATSHESTDRPIRTSRRD